MQFADKKGFKAVNDLGFNTDLGWESKVEM